MRKNAVYMITHNGICSPKQYGDCSKEKCIVYNECRVITKYMKITNTHADRLKVRLQDVINYSINNNILSREEIDSMLFEVSL